MNLKLSLHGYFTHHYFQIIMGFVSILSHLIGDTLPKRKMDFEKMKIDK